ncbi:MAG: response regulator [Solirubrobacteraceae bacterium]
MSCLADAVPVRTDETSEASPLTVLIADDHPLVIAGVRRALEGHDDIEVIGEAHSGPEVLQMIERRRPRLVLLDLSMPGVAGLELIEQVVATWPSIKMVILSSCEDRGVINGALVAGANAYVVKSVLTMDVAAVLRQAASGGVFHAATQQHDPSWRPPEPAPQAALTAREQAILRAVAQGLTTAAVSKDLWVSEHTVKFHLTNIYRKLGVANRAGAIRYALENGLAAA